MKIIFLDSKTQESFRIFHHPQEILIKPKKQIVKHIEKDAITQWHYTEYTYYQRHDDELDCLELIMKITVDRNSELHLGEED